MGKRFFSFFSAFVPGYAIVLFVRFLGVSEHAAGLQSQRERNFVLLELKEIAFTSKSSADFPPCWDTGSYQKILEQSSNSDERPATTPGDKARRLKGKKIEDSSSRLGHSYSISSAFFSRIPACIRQGKRA